MHAGRARALASALLLGPMLLGGACFKIEKLPALLLVDDFEDRDMIPLSSKFGPWRCGIFSTPIEPEDGGTEPERDGGLSYPDAATGAGPTSTPTTCAFERPGDLSNWGLRGEYEISNTPDQGRRSAGFEIVTPAISAPLDVSGFHVVGLSARIDLDAAAVPTVEVALLCGMAWKYQQVTPIRIGADWQSFQLDVADFNDPFSPRNPSCLFQVHGLRFSVRPGLQDGHSARGALSIDNVYLEP